MEGTAEGNALGKGPVVFEVHQSAIEIIRKLAAREFLALLAYFCCAVPFVVQMVMVPRYILTLQRDSMVFMSIRALLICR